MENIKEKSSFLLVGAPILSTVIAVLLAWFLPLIGYIIGALISLIVGIIVLIKWSQLVSGVNAICKEDGEKNFFPYIAACLLGIITLGIYYIYYLYKIQARMHENAKKYNVIMTASGDTILIWTIVGIFTAGIGFIVAQAILVKTYNKLVSGYLQNNEIDDEEKETGSVTCVTGTKYESLVGATLKMESYEEVIIGRDASRANLIISDKKVSKEHCKISYDSFDKKYRVIDLSTNGTTFNNGTKLPKNLEVSVNPGTILNLSNETKIKLG